MLPNVKFLNQSYGFWAYVRAISEKFGYTRRNTSTVSAPSESEVMQVLRELNLGGTDIKFDNKLDARGHLIVEYFHYRADTLNNRVKGMLMDAEEARALFQHVYGCFDPKCPLPMNKQKGEKKAKAYLTCLVNIMIESIIGDLSCDYDPRQLTKITDGRQLLSTLSRRMDGAFPSTVNPIAIWEIKEYYYTTTFGSRIADGVYETLLDGMELRDLKADAGIHVKHYLIIDSYKTWWSGGRSYLCRILDMMHMGYVDEVVFGREVIDRIPSLASKWCEELDVRV
ncbi:MAG: hypothetical protein F4138_03290 [Acidimicrobiia bacterium]|nr:hypothetical protein [Acidimicrobiia bacterium]MYC57785.1 hypothetical protein [Acidimicrobiia bacterium]MYG94003.1 hypothetical protein [Acidimicrobiia bacterium]MYI29806.1 hypothetical protein [Acidimicrobiia bacterium]